MTTLTVTLPAARYDITITSGALSRVGELTKAQAPHRRALLVVDRAIVHTHGEVARRSLQDAGYDVAEIHLEASETHKTLQVIQRIYGVMLAHRLERSSPVVAVGGGIVGDVAGFAAATYLRGVPLIQAPTTLWPWWMRPLAARLVSTPHCPKAAWARISLEHSGNLAPS
jgi:3-dehydroquinate synthase